MGESKEQRKKHIKKINGRKGSIVQETAECNECDDQREENTFTY